MCLSLQSHDPENDSIKAAIPKSSKTSSPFEPIENNNKSGDSQSELLINNGDEGFRWCIYSIYIQRQCLVMVDRCGVSQ